MKKMIQRLITLTAALALVLSMTAMVCSADYTEESDEHTPAPCFDLWYDNDDRE